MTWTLENRLELIKQMAEEGKSWAKGHQRRKKKFEKQIVEVLESEVEPKTLSLKEVFDG